MDLNGLVATAEGAPGLTSDELGELAPDLAAVRTTLGARRAEGTLPFLLPSGRRDDLRRLLETAAAVRAEVDTVVVVGTPPSSFGARLLAEALDAEGAPGVRLVVVDTVDPAAIHTLLEALDLKRTLFNVVSRSGDTAETMALFLIVRDRLLRELGALDYKERLIVTTDAQRGSLRQIINDEGFRDVVVPPGLDGRFAALSPLGLFPAAAAGIDVEELIAGAAFMEARGRAAETPLADPPVVLAGALHRLARRYGRTGVRVRPYSDRLAPVRDWMQTAWRLVGPDAQGPGVTLFLRVEEHGTAVDVPAGYQDLDDVGYLGGHSLGELRNAQQRAAEATLARHAQPSVTVTLPALNPFTVGQLLFLLQMTAVVTDSLTDTPVDPVSLDGEAQRLTCGLLGRTGFGEEAAEVEQWLARKDPRLVL